MRLRSWLITLLGLNLVLAAGWYFSFQKKPEKSPPPKITKPFNPFDHEVKTNVVVRRQNFTWEEVESSDYVTYIKNLRNIGCPEQTIRDIIVADVNQLYAHHRVTEVTGADHQWWRSDPDPQIVQAAIEKLKNLEMERRGLLTKLLGPNWETTGNLLPPAIRTGISLTGPLLGDLPTATKQTVYDITVKTQQKIDAYQETQRQQNKPIDPAEISKIRQQSRSELAGVLNPEQMEEFLLRYSQTAKELREDMRGLNLSPEEFRALFRGRDPINLQIENDFSGSDPASVKHRQDLEIQREDSLKQSLGTERYATYKLNQDPVFQQSKATAAQLGVGPQVVMPIYEINRLTQTEMDRIRNDATMTNEEKVEALAATQVDQQKSLEKILGPKAFQHWLEGMPPPLPK